MRKSESTGYVFNVNELSMNPTMVKTTFIWFSSPGGGTLQLKIRGAGSIVWGLGFWLGKYILGFFKNIDLDNS